MRQRFKTENLPHVMQVANKFDGTYVPFGYLFTAYKF